MNHTIHVDHAHVHGASCGHVAVRHERHVDYLHGGHMHHVHGDHVDDCQVAVSRINPKRCTPNHECLGHAADHEHNRQCGHPLVPHGDHVDYLVGDHLHHPCAGHCDHHGELRPVAV